MRFSSFICIIICLAFHTCRPALPDPVDRYVGSWDCVSSVNESGIGPPRNFRELKVVEITKLSPKVIAIAFPDSSGLRVEGTVDNTGIVIQRQVREFYSSNQINGPVTILGSGTLSQQSNQFSLTYTAIGVNSPYSRSVQMVGSKK